MSPVLNKIRAFLTDPLLLTIVGQAKSRFDFRWMMDNRKILLCDLSKGAIGDDNANLLGSLIVIKERLAALSREDIPESKRVPHVLYVEEAHNFVGDFASILAKTRKYGLALVPVTQGTEQLEEDDVFAIFSNCATIITFRVSGEDARRLETQFTAAVPAKVYQDLPDYKVYVRTMITRRAWTPWPMRSLPYPLSQAKMPEKRLLVFTNLLKQRRAEIIRIMRNAKAMTVADLNASQCVRFSPREAPKAHNIEQLENRRVRANTQRERKDGYEREGGSLAERTSCVPDVLDRRLQPQRATSVAAGLLDLLQSAEFLSSPATSLALTQAGISER